MIARLVVILSTLAFIAAVLGVGLQHTFAPSGQTATEGLRWAPGTLALVTLLSIAFTRWAGHRRGFDLFPGQPEPVAIPSSSRPAPKTAWHEMHREMAKEHGYGWRRKLRVLLVIGESDEIAAIAPELTRQRWLQVPGAVLLCGDSVLGSDPKTQPLSYPGLGRWRAIDGVVWALSRAQTSDIAYLVLGLRYLRLLSRQVRWQLPLYLWEIFPSLSRQQGRHGQPVGCLLEADAPEDELPAKLAKLQIPLHEVGVAQLLHNKKHDFLLRLADHLEATGSARWRQTLASLRHEWGRGVRLRGLSFSLTLARHDDEAAHYWQADPAWQSVLHDHHAPRVWRGAHPGRLLHLGGTALVALAALGLVGAFVVERLRIHQIDSTLTALTHAPERDQQAAALGALSQQLSALKNDPRGWPAFGFDRTPVLVAAAWPHFVQGTLRLVRDPMALHLHQQLQQFVQRPADAQSVETTRAAYDQLKAYLMLANPEKAQPDVLSRAASAAVADSAQALFFAQQLPLNPQWRIEADPPLIVQVRQRLIHQLADRTDEAALYQGLLDSASHHVAPMTLHDMLGTADTSPLFTSNASVPGAFTRQTWQQHISEGLQALVAARESQTGWVLGELSGPQATRASGQALQQRLTQRYWRDYSRAWQGFLDSLRVAPVDGLEAATERLAAIADPRRSPLRALLQTFAEQGRVAPDDAAMRALFGPLLTVMDTAARVEDDRPRLTRYLSQVSSLQRRLERITQARDPCAAADDLARAFLKGHNPEAAEAPAYGRALVQALGKPWRTAGPVLFVEPAQVAWDHAVQPSLANLNRDWQQRIAEPWRDAFTGRYPFAQTPQDTSLSTLGRMIRADTGLIDRFVRQELGELLQKQDGRWIANPHHAKGLNLNPEWLAAINQLSQLETVIYSDGAMVMHFELSGQARADTVQTRFVLDGNAHEYFNQKPAWHPFSWPGLSPAPGVRLSWAALHGDEQLYGSYLGVWGLVRLFEQARLTPLPDSPGVQRMVIRAPDGTDLTWHLRTGKGDGPLALLQLRDFTLPDDVFLTGRRLRTGAASSTLDASL